MGPASAATIGAVIRFLLAAGHGAIWGGIMSLTGSIELMLLWAGAAFFGTYLVFVISTPKDPDARKS
jgi:hypothetical protein